MTTIQEKARQALREAMDRYGFTDADAGHARDTSCWCGPDRACAVCGASGPCIHGSARPYHLIHRKAS